MCFLVVFKMSQNMSVENEKQRAYGPPFTQTVQSARNKYDYIKNKIRYKSTTYMTYTYSLVTFCRTPSLH